MLGLELKENEKRRECLERYKITDGKKSQTISTLFLDDHGKALR